jgi:hypothetical protein
MVCTDVDYVEIEYNNAVVPTCPGNFAVLLNSDPVPLTATPPGGEFSGIGVVGNTFDPTGLMSGYGYTIFYTYTNSPCPPQTCIFQIAVFDVQCPENFQVCSDAEPFLLTGCHT